MNVGARLWTAATERTDRGEKSIMYRGIATLAVYIIVEQERRWVDRHWRDARGQWQRDILADNGTVTFSHPACSLTLDEIYEDVDLPSPEEYVRRLRLREEAASYG